MNHADVVALAGMFREFYNYESLDTGVSEPTLVEHADGGKSLTLPREQMWEPWRSFRLIDAVAVHDAILVITFSWDDGADDGTVFLMPLDARDIELNMSDSIAVDSFLSHHLEFTLGGPRESWEPRSTPLASKFAVIRPWTQRHAE